MAKENIRISHSRSKLIVCHMYDHGHGHANLVKITLIIWLESREGTVPVNSS